MSCFPQIFKPKEGLLELSLGLGRPRQWALGCPQRCLPCANTVGQAGQGHERLLFGRPPSYMPATTLPLGLLQSLMKSTQVPFSFPPLLLLIVIFLEQVFCEASEMLLEPHENPQEGPAGSPAPESWREAKQQTCHRVCPTRQEDRSGCRDPCPREPEQGCACLEKAMYFLRREL